jgi:soluble lytic murein transglycosylase
VPGAALALGVLAFPRLAAGGEPLCDWLQGLGSSAQARLEGDPAAADQARRALAALPGGEAAARASLALGLALDAPSDTRERLAALRTGLLTAPPALRAAIQNAIGDALDWGGDPRGAVDAFRAAASEGSGATAERARWRLAEALHRSGLFADAAAAWRALLKDPLASTFEADDRLALAHDLHAAGDKARAALILRALWSSQPERPEGAAAAALLSRWRAEGDPIPPITSDERIARALRLIALGRGAEARAELREAESGASPAAEDLVALVDGAALLTLGRSAEARLAVEPLVRSDRPGIRRGAQVILARIASREHRLRDAIAAWRAVAGNPAAIPGAPAQWQSTLRDDAEFLAAWLPFDAGDLQAAATGLGELASARPSSRRADDARWFAAWALVRMGATAKADAALRKLDAGEAAPRVRYWRARIAEDPSQSEALLRSVVTVDSLGYYGILACARLRARGIECPQPPLGDGRPPPDLDSVPDAPRLRLAAQLAAAGLRDEAIAELAEAAGTNGARKSAQLTAELASFLGDPGLPFRVARDVIGLSRRTLVWSFPDAWPHLVLPAARAARVDPALLRAVMRRESGFRSKVRSPAGAVGLLQIIPSTAARLAALLALPEPLDEQLEDPRVNIALGAGYLSLLLERFGEPLAAVAAYNAGPDAVLRWNRDRSGLPLDAWVESIPYRETRQYVRAVVENWAGARAAAGEPPPPIDPDRTVPAPAATGVGF